MKFDIGDRVIFIKKSDKEDSWKLNNFEEYVITGVSKNLVSRKDYPIIGFYYGVKHKSGSETTWYLEDDFLTIKEYRKLKLKKLNEFF